MYSLPHRDLRQLARIWSFAGVCAVALGLSWGCEDQKPRLGGFCDDSTSCPAGQICLDGMCAFACNGDKDCAQGFVCQDEVCIQECETTPQCQQPPLATLICIENRCQRLNPPGVVELGGSRTVAEGDVVTLSAAESIFTQPSTTAVRWELVASNPKGVDVTLVPGAGGELSAKSDNIWATHNKADSVEGLDVSFLAPAVVQDTELRFRATAQNGDGQSTFSEVSIFVQNTINEPPAAVMGEIVAEVKSGDLVVLLGDSSSDPNPSDALTFGWQVSGHTQPIDVQDAAEEGQPPFSRAQFLAPAVDETTLLKIVLTVGDGKDSANASAEITVLAVQACKPGDNAACDDSDPCTDDECNEAGECTYAFNSAPCDDGNACTGTDTCLAGACAGAALTCDDNNPCTQNDCDSDSGCAFAPISGESCDDGDACTEGDTCNNGSCAGGAATDCNDGNPCTNNSCDPATGCVAEPMSGPNCDDDNPCTIDDACISGNCAGLPLVDCDDGNPCTIDLCSLEAGCTYLPAADPCDDGNACTAGETCVEGACVGGTSVPCNDNNPCTDDACAPASGCVFTPSAPKPCNDGNACTSGEQCQSGACTGGAAVVCDDGNLCTTNSCAPATGCAFTNTTGPCDDGNACTTGEQCQGGACTGGSAVVCNDNNACTNDSCSSASGCVFAPSAPKACNDGNACTAGDTCAAGSCQPTGTLNCNDGNPCTQDSCAPGTGCVHAPLTGPACDDGVFCTVSDSCVAGQCAGGGPNAACQCQNNADCAPVDDGNPCNGVLECTNFQCVLKPGSVVQCSSASDTTCSKNQCNPSTGACQMTPVAAGTSCNDGSACTTNDACQSGACVGGPAPNCDDGNACTQDGCNPASGCFHTALNNAPCSDGNACTVGDTCQGGTCLGSTANCSDGNPCTADGCNSATGCTWTPASGTCNDGNACTTGDFCQGGQCVGGPATNCNDNNPCTLDGCNASTGCFHTNLINVACSDSNACTGPDTCAGGSCSGPVITCNDNNPCTTDSCNPATGCVFAPTTGACNDGNACTLQDQCSGGQCVGGPALVCNDNNPCTTDSCSPASGCVFAPASGACDDGNLCTIGDFCNQGACAAGAPAICADNNPCTADSCAAATGCVNAPVSGPCSDNNACTVGDTCSAGSCAPGTPAVCNDNNPCTSDGCNAATGCVFTPNSAPCNDGDPCTSPDICTGGSCVGGPSVCECQKDSDCVDDGNLCNGVPKCNLANNTCFVDPATVITCSDNNPNDCLQPVCQPTTGQCLPVAVNAGTVCNDNSACTTGDACNAQAQCVGTTISCNDGNPCTTDTCAPATGCVYTANSASCNDGNACTTGDTCVAGQCVGTGSLTCSTNNPCLQASCDPGSGCITQPKSGPCTDNNACTNGDQCQAGTCVGGPPLVCNDNNPCTNDSCNATSGCVYTPNTANCDDGNACTANDKCSGGQCLGGPAVNCNDNNPCTTDSCSAASGCVNTANNQPCNDGNACTTNDQCSGGQCLGGPALVCNDNNPCTNDSCNPSSGCAYAFNSAPCSDGNECTSGDICASGQCVPGQNICSCTTNAQCPDDDNLCNGVPFCDTQNFPFTCKVTPGSVITCPNSQNPCQISQCAPSTGQCTLQAAPNGLPCNDGNACSLGERCEGGECSIGAPAGCVTSNGPGCYGCACESCVCAADPFCCNNSWDNLCVNRCQTQCGQNCGFDPYVAPADAGCFTSNTPTCPGCACELCVCENDSFCCNTAWDGLCASGCAACGSNCQLSTPGCVAKVKPGCNGCECESSVCKLAPSCCEVAWGPECVTLCAQQYEGNYCASAPSSTKPGCFTTQTPGCQGCECESCVCASDPFCCNTSWDQACVSQCLGQCGQSCTNKSTLDCDDGNPCTLDTCIPSQGCVNLPMPSGSLCNDGNPCTVGDVCSDGFCKSGPNSLCDDGNPCTDDICSGGKCAYQANKQPCDDGNSCTLTDICSSGQCMGSGLGTCDDGNPCTTDVCNPKGMTCSSSPSPMGTPCQNDAAICGFQGGCKSWNTHVQVATQTPNTSQMSFFGVHELNGDLLAAGGSGTLDTSETLGFIYRITANATAPTVQHQRSGQLSTIYSSVAAGVAGSISRHADGGWQVHAALEKNLGIKPHIRTAWQGLSGLSPGNISYLFGFDGTQFDVAPVRICFVGAGESASCSSAFAGGPVTRVDRLTAISTLGGAIAPIWSISSAWALTSNPAASPPTNTSIYRGFSGPSDWTNSPTAQGCTPTTGSACHNAVQWTDLVLGTNGQLWATAAAGRLARNTGGAWQIVPIGGLAPGLAPTAYDLQAVVAVGDDVFVAAQTIGCGTGSCATDGSWRSHVLLHFNSATNQWFPQRVLSAVQCTQTSQVCGAYYASYRVRDMWWSSANSLAIVGSRPNPGSSPATPTWRLLTYVIGLN